MTDRELREVLGQRFSGVRFTGTGRKMMSGTSDMSVELVPGFRWSGWRVGDSRAVGNERSQFETGKETDV